MAYSKEFYNLNLLYARRVAEVAALSLAEALLNYTNLYTQFNLGRDFDPDDATWQGFIGGLEHTGDTLDWTFQFALRREMEAPPQPSENAFGCFSYTLGPEECVRLYFHNRETGGVGPLSHSRLHHRLIELGSLFAHLRRAGVPVRTVVGDSWLYHLEAYQRLFPPAFIATAEASYTDFQFLALWGQFLDRSGEVRADTAGEFLKNMMKADTLSLLERCFPFPVLRLECPIEFFNDFYGFE